MKKHICSALLALFLLISVFPLGAFAAPSFPALSNSNYCEMIAPAQINVYCDYNMTTRGTLSPYKEYNAYLDAGDTVQILEVTSSYVVLNYPTPSGTKTGVVNTSHIFGTSEVNDYISSSKASVSTYSSNSNANRYGSIAVGDEVFRLGSTKNGYILVIYTAQSGARAFKAGFITGSDFDLVKNGSASNAPANTGTQALTYGLYHGSGSITCGFDGYKNTNGRHEGIDMAKGIDSAVYSLTDGVITRVTEGANGSDGLSTIAIYNASADKTIVYLHANPLDELYVGKQISRGEQIAIEAWRGLSSASSAHTHVEVRNGERTAAAKSVNDQTLDNPNPTSFWNAQGYTLQ